MEPKSVAMKLALLSLGPFVWINVDREYMYILRLYHVFVNFQRPEFLLINYVAPK